MIESQKAKCYAAWKRRQETKAEHDRLLYTDTKAMTEMERFEHELALQQAMLADNAAINAFTRATEEAA